jgi:hypothetical protein
MSSAVVLAAAATFNLACTATMEEGSAKAAPIVETFRVDLDQYIWCRGACEATRPIIHVNPSVIAFELERTESPPSETTASVNLDTRYFIVETRAEGVLLLAYGSCKRRKFTGFPLPKSDTPDRVQG